MSVAGPLSGVRVLDLTVALAGPWCTQILASLGAEVIKLEPVGGEETRYAGPPFWDGESPLFLAANSGKRSVAVELAGDEGREIALELAARCDVFIQNLRAGAAERLGLGYDAVSAVSPRIVYCSISAFGTTGPLAGRPAYDLLLQAMGGVMSTTGEPDGRPLRAGPALVDLTTGMWAAIGILGALHEPRDGPRRIDTSLYEAAVNLQPIQFAQYLAGGEVAGRLGASGNILVPFETLPTADGQIVIAAGNNRLFARLVTVLGLPELAEDAHFRENADRVRNREALAALLGGRLAERPTADWLEALGAAGVPAGTVKDIGEIVAEPQFDALGIMPRVSHDTVTGLRVLAPAVSYDGERLRFAHGAPRLGADTSALLAELGYDEARIAQLVQRGVLAAPAPPGTPRHADQHQDQDQD